MFRCVKGAEKKFNCQLKTAYVISLLHNYRSGNIPVTVRYVPDGFVYLGMEKEEIADLLIETLNRCNLIFPMTEQDALWFDSGTDAKTKDGKDFLSRVFNFTEQYRNEKEI